MKYLFLIALLVIAIPVSAQMYRYVDDQGKVHFSDKPVAEGAQPYEPTAPIITVPSGSNAGGLQPLSRPSSAPFKYKSVRITAPANDHVFTPDQTASIAVSIEVDPPLRGGEGHVLEFYLDGQLYAKGAQTSYNLVELNRGTHTVSASIVDDRGKKLKSSDSVSFHVQRHHL